MISRLAIGIAAVAVCAVLVARARAQPTPPTDDEVAAAKRDGVGCKSLADPARFRSRTHARIAAAACKRDRWALRVVVCFQRDFWADCDELLPKRARDRYRKQLARSYAAVLQEHRAWTTEPPKE